MSNSKPEVSTDGGRNDSQGPAAGSYHCSECGYIYFSDWGHSRTCSQHPESDRDE